MKKINKFGVITHQFTYIGCNNITTFFFIFLNPSLTFFLIFYKSSDLIAYCLPVFFLRSTLGISLCSSSQWWKYQESQISFCIQPFPTNRTTWWTVTLNSSMYKSEGSITDDSMVHLLFTTCNFWYGSNSDTFP